MSISNIKTSHFRISSALKDIIGKELITEDSVAIFELVKNAFDAHANQIDLTFEKSRIIIADNGKGMSADDLEEKWLFVAYSAKKDGREDNKIDKSLNIKNDFRSRINNRNGRFAGNKGIGRFSCDRLGTHLKLYTKSADQTLDQIEMLEVYWDSFEKDPEEEFERIKISKSSLALVDMPEGLAISFSHGTILEITGLRADWDRHKLLRLKASLAKLINPFGIRNDLSVYLHAPHEIRQDAENSKLLFAAENFIAQYTGDSVSASSQVPTHYHDVVNGKVQNALFERISKNTTNISVHFSDDGKNILSKLYDRGELIYSISEPNEYMELQSEKIDIELHYLNTAAKTVFTKYMGLQPVNFGSVFLFHNGFRVYPVGEKGNDTFGLDARKNQGRARYLGTREVVGRLNIESGDLDKFKEASSRNAGLIETAAFNELKLFFLEKVIKRLEAYVVPVSWTDQSDAQQLDIARIETDAGKARVTAAVSALVKSDKVVLLEYSKNLITILDEKSDNFLKSLTGLEIVAEKTGNAELLSQLAIARKSHAELITAESNARKAAEADRKARLEAEAKAAEARKLQLDAEQIAIEALEAEEAAKAKQEEAEKLVHFFSKLQTNDYDTLLSFHHHVNIYSTEIGNHLRTFLRQVMSDNIIDVEKAKSYLERAMLANSKIQAITKFATKANFMLDGDVIKGDIVNFIDSYINGISIPLDDIGLTIKLNNAAEEFEKSFKPIELSVVIDNLIHNAKKAKATNVRILMSSPIKNQLIVDVIDDGKGISPKISNWDDIFVKGVTTTNGSGLGLYHTKQILSNMGATIVLKESNKAGSTFRIEFIK